ncbi:MAG TPA: hypothetical protein VKY79_00525 [Actinomycetaceae bacterium]|nr:hypothetical protein [Actinomycetaceae bacterium]
MTSRRTPLARVLLALTGLLSMVVLVAVPTAQCLACRAPLTRDDASLVRVFGELEPSFRWGAYAMLVALVLLIVFVAALGAELRDIGAGRLAAPVVLVAGAVLGAGVLVQVLLGLAATIVDDGGGAPVARVVLSVAHGGAFAFAAPLAALAGAVSVVVVRTRWLPRPIGWAGFVVAGVALAWVTPGIGAVLGMAWLAVLSVALAVRGARSARPEEPVSASRP